MPHGVGWKPCLRERARDRRVEHGLAVGALHLEPAELALPGPPPPALPRPARPPARRRCTRAASGRRARRRARAVRRPARPRRRPCVRAGARRRAAPRSGHGSAAPYGLAGSVAARTRTVAVGRRRAPRSRSTAPGMRELRPAESLDEVAAAAPAGLLERLQHGIDAREAARDPLRDDGAAGDDTVTHQQLLGGGVQPARRVGRARRNQAPASGAGGRPEARRTRRAGAGARRAARSRAGAASRAAEPGCRW